MDARHHNMRHRIERRVKPERRTGLDRRIAERRLRVAAVQVERRQFADRRTLIERRVPRSRRSWIDRRGSGIRFTEPPAGSA